MTRHRNALIVLLTGLAVSTAPARAQDKPQPPGPPPVPTVSVRFDGGTIGDYVEAVRRSSQEANIVVTTPEVLGLQLPPVQLDTVGLNAAVQLLSGAYPVDRFTHVRVIVDEIHPSNQDQKPVYRIAGDRRGQATTSEVHVWSVAGLLAQDSKADDVLTAVETAVGLSDRSQPAAEIRFHEATSLLIVDGSPQQIEAIDNVIDALHAAAHERREAARQADQGPLEEAKATIRKLETVLDQRTLQIQRAQNETQGIHVQQETLVLKIQQLENLLQQKEAEINALTERLAQTGRH